MADVTVQKRGEVYQYKFEIASIDGKRKFKNKSGFATKSEAKQAGIIAYNEYLNTGHSFKPKTMSYSDYLDYWMKEHCEINLKYHTIEAYKNIIKNHIKPRLGFYRLCQITTATIQEFVNNTYVEYGYSKNFMKNILKVLKTSFSYATDVVGFVKENHTIKATFAINTYTITSSAGANGTITETATVNYGDSKTFTITPNKNYHIEKVEVDGQDKGTNDTYTFTDVNDNHTIKATFAIDTFAITASVNDSSMGTITETATVNYGDSKTFTMTANTGYGVKDVRVDGISVGPVTSYTFGNVNGNHKIEVEFANATIVTSAQEFRDAVKQNGIIVLANDITLDDNEDVEITGNIIIHGNDYIINLPTADNVIFSGSDSTFLLVNCHFVGDNYIIMKELWIAIYNSVFDNKVKLDANAVLYVHDSTFIDMSWDGHAAVNVLDGNLGKAVGENLENAVSSGVRVYFRIYSGTIYFDPTNYIDTSKYKATKTKDADNVDIWVVTEK